ncbi:Multidrug efflux pump subunit AcrB [Paenibacillus sp. UNCCL117]|uniref:efflux RND transporter permease subunit n=1 Tax=unclassified Paenibacillus TaxID=185978 RepID=UPI0008887514|nr:MULTISPECIES: efflux RND transporter permease subunit [unclassified Paenibacillus]SDD72856.1 Multidrug efflux pump subunit AcrB [Paenibacillus sp. cl123]SFW45792.1 Multidrug efflux pump subunit AcrB [Paenibacillus sp. UNCCL117]
MNRIIQFSMKNVSAVIIIMIMLFIGGFYSTTQLKIENMPDVSFPVVSVTTTYMGAPKDVLDQVTEPLEEKLANLEDLDSMSSTSSDNFSSIVLMFKQNADTDKKKQEVQDLLAEVVLPDAAGTPKASTFGAASVPTNYLVVYGNDGMSQNELDKHFQETIQPGLEGIKGIDHLDIIGARKTSLDIEMDASALDYYGLSPSQVGNAISSAATQSPIGSVEINGNEKMARVTGSLSSLHELEQMEIATAGGDHVQLGRIAEVKAITESDFIGRLDGKPAIGVILYKASSANAVEFSSAIEEKLLQWRTDLPNVTFKNTYDSAEEIKHSIHGLVREGIVGAFLAAVMILIFLKNVRMTLIVLVSLPLSILVTLLLMSQLGLTLNAMTLGGIFMAIGRVVDDSIVVIENIYSSLEKAHERNESVIALATSQVASAITSSTLATAAVFVPMGMISGFIGEFVKPFAITISIALIASLLVALTVIPMLAKIMVLRAKPGKPTHDESKPGRLTLFYEKALGWSLKNRWKTLLVSGGLLLATIAVTLPSLSVSLLPSPKNSPTMYFQIKMPNETSFEATNAKTSEIETILLNEKDSNGEPVFKFVEALVGYAGDDDSRVPYASQLFVEINENLDPAQVKDKIKAFILTELPPGSEVEPKSMESDAGALSPDFAYSLQGEDQTQLEKAALIVKDKLRTFPELMEIEDNLSDKKTEIEITVDQKKAKVYGLNPSVVRDRAAAWIQKQELGDLKFDSIVYTTTVSLDKSDKDTFEKLGNIPMQSSNGSTVLLKEVAKIGETRGSASLAREDQQQLVKVTAKIKGEDKSGVSQKVAAALDEIELPDGVTPKAGGVTDDINDSFSQLFVAMGVAIFLVYIIMVLSFGNASAPFAILFSLPLAVIGGLLGLFLTGEVLNATSMIGFLMLIGIVVTNAIVLIDRAQQLREAGYTVRSALIEAGKVRLRPIVMTAGATITALLPLALGMAGEGVLIGKGLGVVVIGGLITSTVLTLVVVPIIYEMIENLKRKTLGSKSKKKSGVLDSVEIQA